MKKMAFAAACVGAVLFSSSEAFAFRKFLDQFSEHYSANQISTQSLTGEQTCGLCHVRAGGGGQRTPFGEDFRSISLGQGSGFPGIEFLDSDKDGFLNLEEIFLQTAPGKPESTPAGRIALELSAAATLVVRPAAECVAMNLKAFGFSFENGSSDLLLNNVQGEIQVKVNGTNGAILARCDAEKLSGSLQR
ncbi:MAG: hypothetical protein FJY29_04065 [Betaproteobacteria bacterium]|nr:hypothetical protein [Betaproteobacteria bacterium]